jgi:hypothetical protein
LGACLDDDPDKRPRSSEVTERIDQALMLLVSAPAPAGRSGAADQAEFRVGGMVAGRYAIIESLGHGGFAHTWRARDRTTDADRVIKQFHDDATADYARREYDVADRVRHDHCARVYDISAGRPGYLVLEYVPGENLRDFAANQRPDATRYLAIALDALAGLSYLHAHGLVHRDVTPTNVIVESEGGAKLIDFGISGPAGATSIVGTPPFIAPELRAGRGATQLSDIYGFSVTMIYTMLGRYPYTGDPARGNDNRDQLVPLTDDERESWGRFGVAMLDLFFDGAAADPARRPTSADELADRLGLLGEIKEVEGTALVNPVVDELRGLYRASTVGNRGNRGLDDEFARATYVPTLLDTKLMPAVLAGGMRLVLLTGNPGDGKTSFLVQVGGELESRGAEVLAKDDAGWRMRLAGHTFIAVYDASESHEGRSSDELMREALAVGPGEDRARRTVLLAINDGRLLQFFDEHEDLYEDEAAEVRRQLAGKAPHDPGIALVDLKRRTLAPRPGGPSLAGRILDNFTEPRRWARCGACLSRHVCPMVHNAEVLRGPARDGVEELVATSHLRRHRRATFRDVRSAMAWLITGDNSCANVHDARKRGMDLRRAQDTLVEDLAFDPDSADYLVQEWADLDPAETAAPEVERAARADSGMVADPATFTDRDRQRAQRQLFFGLWRSVPIGRSTVRAYRYLDEFEATLAEQTPGRQARILLGLSRLLGAPGYRGDNLAVSDQGAGGTWAVLKEIPSDEFVLEQVSQPSAYVEWRPDALRLRHRSGPSLVLTLDTVELVLRTADGDLIGDSATDSVRQEIETFAAALRHSPASSVRVVDPAGAARRAVIVDQWIIMEPS